ncbi:MAG TPA: winged helix-turn-helix domain-containing protein [Rhizomicrobium sp.]|jgi:predicted ATPase/DNA-binding winged helix-turn-helix (wHTH) protein|nr:winged helix-turn-helix domain-containing protein [Rhizomicrobium sp.]
MTEPYCFGRFTLDPCERTLYADGVPVALGSTDFRVLLALVEDAGAIVTKSQLISRVWGPVAVTDNALYFHISVLRRALGEDCIQNEQRRGYRFVVPVQRKERASSRSEGNVREGNLPSFWSENARGTPARLIGRNEQLLIASNLLAQSRLVTLTGPGGVGKTTLALQAAAEAASGFANGVWLVELAALSDADLVPDAIASTLRVRIGARAAPLDILARHLERKSLLIVLDNCEHVIAAAAHTSEALLTAAPGVKILATSREPLSCSGEHVLNIPPLVVPGEGTIPSDLLRSASAVALFAERATEADAKFRIDDEQLTTVARICRRVDGLPLAIEMVASWAGLLGLEILDARLVGSLKAWLRARSTAPARHSTLRATVEWSYDLLSAAEQTVLRRLAVFADSFTIEAAESVAGDSVLPTGQVFDHLAGLIRKSMIAAVPGSPVSRYRLLETTRAFMLEELAASSDSRAARQRHAAHVLRVLEEATREFETRSDAVWLERYSPVLDDLRAALDWAVHEEPGLAMTLAGMSWPLWRELSLRTEGGQRLRAAAAGLRAGTPAALEARLRHGLGHMWSQTAASKEAHEEIERAVSLYRAFDARSELGGALTTLGYLLLMLGRMNEAEQAILEAVTLLERAGWLRTLAIAYSTLLCIEATLGRFDAALLAGEKAARLSEMVGADRTALVVAANMVQLLLEGGDVEGAISAGRQATSRMRDTRYSDLLGFVFGMLAAAHTVKGNLDEVLTVTREAAPLLRDDGRLFWLFDHLALRACLAGHAKDAALIAGYADAVFEKASHQREVMGRRAVERTCRLLRDALPENEIAELRRLGARLSEDQALGLALSD